ncbi:ubiE COQ5 methyltransferase [Lecanosticta acicola]|uniref:Arsenite methyltransferase n=1 Tax=Lecanosticta acicola TaxID=111012 RepID=A0AAI8YZX9_9PEZI|nr:ubiE COQ5 methyltransferase [Lecanosticta acicola]
MNSTEVYSSVDKHYGAAAKAQDSNGYAQRVAEAFGYSQQDLDGMPEEANLGLSCGNPIALAKLREGETVLDLGSGAGFDVFQASKRVGPTGKSIGVDFNKDMLARANAIKTKIQSDNVEFVDSKITKIEVPTASVDCIISNCVINLVPEEEKQQVFNEMFRLLKSGGRVAVSDILAKGEMPDSVRGDMSLYVGCIAGASEVGAYEKYLRAAGFDDVLIVDAKSDLNVYWQTEGAEDAQGVNACCGPSAAAPPKPAACCGPSNETKQEPKACYGPSSANGTSATNGVSEQNGKRVDFNEYAGSYKIYAIKP